jgi:hypothetical protein
MANRDWDMTGNFRGIGEVKVVVTSPNWQGALRKGALAIKSVDILKGRRIKGGIFTVVERVRSVHTPEPITGEQASFDSVGTVAEDVAIINEATASVSLDGEMQVVSEPVTDPTEPVPQVEPEPER